MTANLDFTKKKLPKCKHCKKIKGLHQAKTLNCPLGSKTRIGYITFSKTQTFES